MTKRNAARCCAVLVALALLGARGLVAYAGPAEPGAAAAADLVKRLGHEQFAAREQASEQLIRLGLAAIPALEEGGKHPDREIRYRSRRILEIIREIDFDRRLDAFAAQREAEDSGQLPGWERFRTILGDDSLARSLFVDMQRAEPALFLAMAQGPGAVGEAISTRAAELRQSTRVFRQRLSLASVAALLFAAGDEVVTVSEAAGRALYSYCYQASFSSALETGRNKELLRKILGLWIRRGDGWNAYQGMMLSVQFGLEDGVVPAERAAHNQANSAQIRQFAILTLAKLGSQTHAPLLESLLEDQTPCAWQQVNDVKYVTQIRDVALAALAHLAKADFKQLGLERVKPHQEFLLVVESIGFASDQERVQALENWRRLREQQQEKAARR